MSKFASQVRVTVSSLLALSVAVSGLFLSAPRAEALDGSSFRPGNIISDAIMFAGGTMSAGEVQNFLNQKVLRCELGDPGKPVGGIFTGSDGSQVRLASTCLKDYVDSVPSFGADAYCGAFTGGNLSAAEMIARAGAACNVNPRALLVLIQKESSLITHKYPGAWRFTKATGLDCPDTAPCSAASAGFFRQVFGAARRLQAYGSPGSGWEYRQPGKTHNIAFNPNASCGSSPVYIENRATAALYYYTPYQPNAAALSDLRGLGDGCSTHGNRNFWVLYNDWFGSTQEIPGSPDFIEAVYRDVLGRAPESTAVKNHYIALMAGGLSRYGMANAFNNSDEYRMKKITEAYQRALKRDPEPGGAAYWLGELRRGRLSPEELYSTFLFSDEMYYGQGGGTNAGYVTALYRELLMREPDQGGMNDWMTRLSTTGNRSIVSSGIWYSPEKYRVRANEAYVTFLDRSAAPQEQDYWGSVAQATGATNMRSMIIASAEYWNRALSRF